MKFFSWFHNWLQGFSGRIFRSLLLAMLGMVVVFNLVFMDLQKDILTREEVRTGINQAELLAYSVRLGVFAENVEQLQLPVEAVCSREEVRAVFVFDGSGRRIFARRRPGAVVPDRIFSLRPIGESDAPGVEGPGFELVDDCFCFRAPVEVLAPTLALEALYFQEEEAASPGKEVIGSVMVVAGREGLQQALHEIFTRSLLLTAVFLLFTILVTFVVVRQASRPIEELLGKVRKMSGREGQEEIYFLDKTFSALLAELRDSFRTINDLKLNLEDKVAERTAELAGRQDELVKTNIKLTQALSALRNAQSRLVQSEKMAALGRLVAGIAHEINNTTNFISGAVPSLQRLIGRLGTIVSSCESMKSGRDYECEVKKLNEGGANCRRLLDDVDVLLANISEGARRTTDIVWQLRNFSGHDEEKAKGVDINACLESALTFAQLKYTKRITVVRDYDPRLPPLTCMPGKINQVFLNLLLNAMQAISGEGTVTVRTWRQGDNVHILIKDSGHGIAAADLEKIFDPFFSRKEDGTGLGLSISYTIVEEHGGEILVRSARGEGAEFEVVLPQGTKT